MPRLARPSWKLNPFAGLIRDITPTHDAEAQDAFALTKQDDWRSEVEPYLNGQPHRYRLVVHFDAAVKDLSGNVVSFDSGRLREIAFESSAGSWKVFESDYWEALRTFLSKVQRMKLIDQLRANGGIRKLKRK